MYNENSVAVEKESKAGKIGKKIVRIIFYLFFAALILIIIIRSSMMKPTAKMRRFLWNENSIEAYNTYGDELKVYTLFEYNSSTSENIFTISDIRYIENISQFQFTLRWNNNTVANLMALDGIEAPNDGSEPFLFAIGDNNGKVYTDYEYTSDLRYNYSFRRIVFDGIDLKDVQSLSVLAYTTYEKDEITKNDACSQIPLYVYSDNYAKYRIKSSEMFKNNSQTADLTKVSYSFSDKK